MIKKNDFIELEYTGATDDGIVFDTTDETTAKENELHNPQMKYGPAIICVGEGQVLEGLDKQLIGKETEKEYEFSVLAEDGFGKRNAKHIQLINTSKFKKQNITPMPGLQVNIDNMMGVVKTVTGSRTMVDFNHPLAGKDLVYKVKTGKLVTDTAKQARSYVEMVFGQEAETMLSESKLTIKTKMKLPDEVTKKIKEKIIKLIPKIKEVDFSQ